MITIFRLTKRLHGEKSEIPKIPKRTNAERNLHADDVQTRYSHNVPDDTGAVRAGRHTLFVITLDFDACDGAPVLLHGLQQPMTFRLQFPDAHLKRAEFRAHVLVQDFKAGKLEIIAKHRRGNGPIAIQVKSLYSSPCTLGFRSHPI